MAVPEPKAERRALMSLGADPDGNLLYLSGTKQGYQELATILREFAERPLGSLNPLSKEAEDAGTRVSSLLSPKSELWFFECSLVEDIPTIEAQAARTDKVRDRIALFGCAIFMFVGAFLIAAMARGVVEIWRDLSK